MPPQIPPEDPQRNLNLTERLVWYWYNKRPIAAVAVLVIGALARIASAITSYRTIFPQRTPKQFMLQATDRAPRKKNLGKWKVCDEGQHWGSSAEYHCYLDPLPDGTWQLRLQIDDTHTQARCKALCEGPL
jgi:hypothetical protein